MGGEVFGEIDKRKNLNQRLEFISHIAGFNVFIILSVLNISCMNQKNEQSTPRILVFSKTEGWRHDSIEAEREAIISLANGHGVRAEASEEAGLFTDNTLVQYNTVIFLNTTGTIFTDNQRTAFERYIRRGGGFVGIHSATDTEYEWSWYNRLVGAYFKNHPNDPNVREAVLNVIDAEHPATHHLPEQWPRADEWYNFRDMNEDVTVLIKLDTDSYKGSEHPGNHPVSWYHEYDGGRAFYTALGHTIESFSEDLFLRHLWGGIEYAMGIM
jgi:type 1 glutamine amidotransferase